VPRVVLSFSNPAKAQKYRDALAAAAPAGARLELIAADSHRTAPGEAGDLLAGADGLLLTGGPDVVPARYGEPLDPGAGVESIPERDALEWALLEAARARRTPVLGICRGHQVVHAFLGGTLWQDLERFEAGAKDRHDPDHDDRRRLAHAIAPLAGDHPLQRLLAAAGALPVNSLHHQAVRDAAPGTVVAAAAPDGVIEASAVDDPSWWVWAVQWHPEELVAPGDAPLHRELFARFLAAASAPETVR
jgi:putative glutamine amidotransferase